MVEVTGPLTLEKPKSDKSVAQLTKNVKSTAHAEDTSFLKSTK